MLFTFQSISNNGQTKTKTTNELRAFEDKKGTENKERENKKKTNKKERKTHFKSIQNSNKTTNKMKNH